MKFFSKIPKFVQTIITSFQEPSGKGSGKRLSLFVIVALISFSVLMYTNKENLTTVVSELSLLTVALAGVTAHYKDMSEVKDDLKE